MGALATALAPLEPHVLEVGDKSYPLNPVDQRMKVLIEKHLFNKAFQAEEMLSHTLTADEYSARLDKLKEDWENGKFAFESEKCMRFLKTPCGIMKLASLIVGVDEMELVKLLGKKQTEIFAMVKLILKESFG